MGVQKIRKRRFDWGTAGFIVTLLTPGLLLYVLLVLWPMAQSFWVALHRWRGVSGRMEFVGLENFVRLAQDERFLAALGHNLAFFLMVAVTVLTLSLFFANALAQRLKGVEYFRALFLFPNVVSVVAVSTLWMFLYNSNWGLINALIHGIVGIFNAALGPFQAWGWVKPIEFVSITWLTQPTALPAVAASYVWYVLGFYILLFRAGIQNISTEINEAAMIDGASGTQRFWFVTLPLLNDIVRLAVIYLIINSMNLFALIWIMAPPSGTARATEVALTYLYHWGFEEYSFGYSSAIGAVNFIMVMAITVLLQRVWKTE